MAKRITILTGCICFLLLTVALSPAATKGRILSNDKVSLYKNGKVIKRFAGQGPVDENALIACDGSCIVKIKGVSLIARDQPRFAVKESDRSINLYVETGIVHFAISDMSKNFLFYTPDNYLIQSEGFITPASTDNSVRGFMRITDRGPQIGMEQGAMVIHTDGGTEMVGQGQAILLAMADVPEIAATAIPSVKTSNNSVGPRQIKRSNKSASLVIENITNGNDADKTPGPTITIGDDVNWKYTISNTGAVVLTGIEVVDDQGVKISCPGKTLSAGATMTCESSSKATAGQYKNIATATGKLPDGSEIRDSDPSHYFGSAGPPCPFFSWDCKTTAELIGLSAFAIESVVAGVLLEDALSDRGRESASPNQ